MSDVQEIKRKIKHFEYLQKKKLTKRARASIVRMMPGLVAANNDAVREANRREMEREIRSKNEVLAHEAFDRHARGRIVV